MRKYILILAIGVSLFSLGCCQYANHARANAGRSLTEVLLTDTQEYISDGFATRLSKVEHTLDVLRFEAWHLDTGDQERIQSIEFLVNNEVIAAADWDGQRHDDRLVLETPQHAIVDRGQFIVGPGLIRFRWEQIGTRVTTLEPGNPEPQVYLNEMNNISLTAH